MYLYDVKCLYFSQFHDTWEVMGLNTESVKGLFVFDLLKCCEEGPQGLNRAGILQEKYRQTKETE